MSVCVCVSVILSVCVFVWCGVRVYVLVCVCMCVYVCVFVWSAGAERSTLDIFCSPSANKWTSFPKLAKLSIGGGEGSREGGVQYDRDSRK